jgi:hypothetical protein
MKKKLKKKNTAENSFYLFLIKKQFTGTYVQATGEMGNVRHRKGVAKTFLPAQI